ncbi:MAG: stage II sporulation protein E (SpoIIE), partial [Hymenobacter sp.]
MLVPANKLPTHQRRATMRIYSALQMGAYHTNHCEDYLLVSEIGDNKIICAVMDGCTMATDSYFASTLVGKLLRKIAKEKSYQELYEPATFGSLDDYLKAVLKDLFGELRQLQNQLMLDERELLTTLVLLLLDLESTQGIVLVLGDGLISINGELMEFDQDNKPDYIGYHLREDFETWYSHQKQKLSFNKANDISITTDGIFTFESVHQPTIT